MMWILKPQGIGLAIMLAMTLLPTSLHGQGPFQRALTQGDVTKIRALVGNDSKLLATPLAQTQMAPLHFAIQQGKLELVSFATGVGRIVGRREPAETDGAAPRPVSR